MNIHKHWSKLFFAVVAVAFFLIAYYVVEDAALAIIFSCIIMATLTSIMMSRPVSPNGYGRS